MRVRTSLFCLLIGTLIIGNIQVALGNGRTMPRSSGTLPLKATCTQIEGDPLEIFRVRVVGGGGSDETLRVSMGGVTEELSLREIKQLRFSSTETNDDGFMNVEILGINGPEIKPAMVQVRSLDTAISLTGFRSNGSSVSIDLSRCMTIEFSFIGKDIPDWDPGRMKAN